MSRKGQFAAAVLMLCGVASPAAAQSDAARGRALLTDLCGRCHAVGRDGASPHRGAPPFRDLGRLVDLGRLAERLEEGLSASHPDMPEFRFKTEDARDARAYLRSIQK